VKAHERERLERLVRYMARPPIGDERIEILDSGEVRLALKTAWRDGTTHLCLTGEEFLEKLVALIPLPRIHLTRYFGVLASRSQHRTRLPDKPEPPSDSEAPVKEEKKGSRGASSRRRKLWAELMKRSFAIDVLQCPRCQGRLALIAVVCDSASIHTTLVALGLSPRPPPLAPPRSRNEIFD
jgi:hypothetical protein